ncbi:MAG: hypothetical protein ACE5FS_12270, partial [Paracoccaceae bacterium]
SCVDCGHDTTLFTYGPVEGVPEGVRVRDGNEIYPAESFVENSLKGSLALFSDLFRYHMIAREPGMIWVDTDIYVWRPIDIGTAHVFGYESENRMNGAVLGLPPDSEALDLMLEFTRDEFPIPPFFPARVRREYSERHEAGNPAHVSEMKWGVWGPLCVTHFLNRTGEAKYAQPREVFYPVHFRDKRKFFRRPAMALRQIAENTHTVHIWAPVKRVSGQRYGGGVPEKSFLDVLLKKHGIDHNLAAVTRHAKHVFREDA